MLTSPPHCFLAPYFRTTLSRTFANSNIGDSGTLVCKVDVVGYFEDVSIFLITLRPLDHSWDPTGPETEVYHIYGRDVVTNTASVHHENRAEAVLVEEIFINTDITEYKITLKPTGDDIHAKVFDYQCPGGCNDGWVDNQAAMHDMVTETIRTVSAHAPVCPICIGKDLTQEY